MENGPEFVFQGADISDQVKQIFTEATGLPMVGLLSITPPQRGNAGLSELFTFHQEGAQKQLVELKWVVQSIREVVGAKTLEPIIPHNTNT